MTVSKEQAREAYDVVAQRRYLTRSMEVACSVLRQFIEQSQDSGHAGVSEPLFGVNQRGDGQWAAWTAMEAPNGGIKPGSFRELSLHATEDDAHAAADAARVLAAPAPTQQAVQQPTLTDERIMDFAKQWGVFNPNRFAPSLRSWTSGEAGMYEFARAIEREVRSLLGAAPTPQPEGTFACPICGLNTPHYHSAEERNAYQASGFARHHSACIQSWGRSQEWEERVHGSPQWRACHPDVEPRWNPMMDYRRVSPEPLIYSEGENPAMYVPTQAPQQPVAAGVAVAPDDLQQQAAKVCGYLGTAYDGEPRRVIEALVARAFGVKEGNDGR